MAIGDIKRGRDAIADDEPLDPAVERVRAKLARLMVIGVGTLLLGLVAVFVAVIYRASAEPSTGPSQSEIGLLPGATIRSTDLSENGILVTIDLPDGSVDLVVLDPATGALRGRTTFRPSP